MEFKPFEKKLVAVLNEKIELGRAMNALAHMAIGLGASVKNREELRLQNYTDANQTIHPSLSDIPFIILKATSNQIRTLRQQIKENNIEFTDFTHTMIEETYIQQHQRTQETKEEDLTYFGVVLFGNWETVSTLTKKFSLFK